MEYFERPGKHDNAVDGDFPRRHLKWWAEYVTAESR